MQPPNPDDLYPECQTLEKAYNLISCACKQGRSEIRLRASYSMLNLLRKEGFSVRSAKALNIRTEIIVVNW